MTKHSLNFFVNYENILFIIFHKLLTFFIRMQSIMNDTNIFLRSLLLSHFVMCSTLQGEFQFCYMNSSRQLIKQIYIHCFTLNASSLYYKNNFVLHFFFFSLIFSLVRSCRFHAPFTIFVPTSISLKSTHDIILKSNCSLDHLNHFYITVMCFAVDSLP